MPTHDPVMDIGRSASETGPLQFLPTLTIGHAAFSDDEGCDAAGLTVEIRWFRWIFTVSAFRRG